MGHTYDTRIACSKESVASRKNTNKAITKGAFGKRMKTFENLSVKENNVCFCTTVSPLVVDKILQRFLDDRLPTDLEPEIIQTTPQSFAIERQCYINVRRMVLLNGGKMRLGWLIWRSKIHIGAEHHAVWEKDNGDLVCITPYNTYKRTDTIMFVPTDDVYDIVMIEELFDKHESGEKLIPLPVITYFF